MDEESLVDGRIVLVGVRERLDRLGAAVAGLSDCGEHE